MKIICSLLSLTVGLSHFSRIKKVEVSSDSKKTDNSNRYFEHITQTWSRPYAAGFLHCQNQLRKIPMDTVPLFPLPDVILFPGQILPLHIFEPRYREMTHDLLDGKGEIVIGTVLGDDQERLEEVAPVQRIAGLGCLERYEKLPDGRYLIVILGKRRVQVEPCSSDRAYPITRYSLLPDEEPNLVDGIKLELKNMIDQHGITENLPKKITLSQLADILILSTEMDVSDRYNLFSIPNVIARAHRILDFYRPSGD